MTTVEHLFMQIFDRKAWIEGQLRQQIESYDQSLAYNILADGGRPPPWLWDTGSDAPGCPATEELSREQLIQGILFPLPWATTPSTNRNPMYTLPAVKSTNMSQYSSFVSEICTSKECIYPEHIGVATTTNSHHKDVGRDCDMVCSEVVEDSPVSGPLASIQWCRSRKRNPENHLNKTSDVENFGNEIIVEQYARRVTRSMAASLMPDHVKEPSATKNSLAPHSKDGDEAAPSRMATQTLDHCDNISKLSVPSGFTINKATADPEHIGVATATNSHHKDVGRDCDMVCSEVVEDSPVSGPLASIQWCRSRKRNPENHLNKTSDVENFGNEIIVEQYARRVTRSMAASLMPDHVKEPSATKNSLAPHSKDGDEAAPSRMATQTLDHCDNISKLSVPSGFTINKATADQAIFMPTISQKANDITVNTTDDASVRGCCTGAVGKEFVPNGSNFIDPGLKTTLSAASSLSHSQSLVVMKKLSFDGIDVCCLDENPCDSSSQKENLCCSSEGALRKLKSVQSLKEDPLYKDSVHGSGAVQVEEEALHTGVVRSVEVPVSSSTSKERTESQRHPTSTSYNKLHQKLSLLSEEANNSSLSNATSRTSPTSMLKSCLNFSGHQNFQYTVCQESPPGSLIEQSMEQQTCEPITSRQSSIAATRQPQTSSDVEQMHYWSENIKPYDLNKDCTTASEKETLGNCDEVTCSKSFQSIKNEESHRNSKTMLASSGKTQLQQEGVLPAIEVMREEAKQVSGQDHVERRDELLDMVETVKSRFCGNIFSHVPAMGSLEMACATDSREKQSDGSLVERRRKRSCKGKLVKKSVCSLDQLTHDVQSGGSVSLTNEVCLETTEAESVTVEVGSRMVAQPTLIVHTAENDPAALGFQLLRSSAAIPDVSRSVGSALPGSDDHHMVLSAKESVIDTTTRDISEKILTEKSSNAAEMYNKSTKASYFLRSSTNAPKDFGPCKGNAYISPSPKKTLLETKEGENCENVMDAAEKSIIQPSYKVGTQYHSSEPRYFLRSLDRPEKCHVYSELNGTGNATSSKRSRKTMTNAWEISWPKRRKLNRYSDGLATSPRKRLHQPLHTQEETGYSSKRSSENASLEEIQITPSPSGTMLNSDVAKADLGSHSEVHHQSQKQRVREDNSCLKSKDQVMDTCLPAQCTKVVPSPNLADGNPRACLMNEIGSNESTLFKLKEPDTDGRLTDVVSKDHCYGLQSIEEREVFDAEKGLSTYDASVLSNFQANMVDYDESMPEFEGFSIGVSSVMENDICYDSDYPCSREEHISFDAQPGSSTDLVTPTAHFSGSYKINKLSDAFQSLSNRLLEHMNFNDSLYFHGDYIRQFRTSEHDKMSGLYSSLGSAFDCSFVERSYSHSTPSSGDGFGWTVSKPPLTPPLEKSSLRKVSGKSGASSQTLGTNPELVCFRIDENSSTIEDNGHPDKSGTSEEGICSKGIEVLDNRQPLKDVTSTYENVQTLVPLTKTLLERGLEILNPNSCSGTRISVDSFSGNACTSNTDQIGDKENQYLSVNGNKEGKVVHSLCNRSSKPEINVKSVGRNRSQASVQKGCKPNNIISNVSSFIPMVQKKQQATTIKGKKDIKVKALEAAEAAKRLEEKKHIEREMRKAAAKLERERLEQEKQLKQKQLEEEKRRKEADIAARKRQREEEERKEKERKRRCIEESRKLQREQEERLHAKKEEKELRCKAADDDGRKKGLVQEAKQQLKSEKGGEDAGSRKAEQVEPGATKAVISSDGMKGIIQDRMSTTKENQDSQSYEISPYKDSDDEDGEEENMRRRKYIPSWARRECLEQTLLSQQHLNPLEIFCRKSSFNLNEVLYLAVARRRPL